ncbi:hypothetical protein [Helicobacter cetorum]|uniref:Uncharacterized protein n=1 Tax=Helicobacter cetorum (strain ATCC BAA-540 / CCUG 52418 / MIT 99-5656) TaxID=1163745 RepID=I0EUK5_HELCM|nr:hypothetical protein [Helicobacter cetorum]AFI06624.1 hypothetical protein HCD_08200 [Helicobacter cetorum MIT 99-5656]
MQKTLKIKTNSNNGKDNDEKNALNLFGETIIWNDYLDVYKALKETYKDLQEQRKYHRLFIPLVRISRNG